MCPPTALSKSKPSENVVTKVTRTLCSKLCQLKVKYVSFLTCILGGGVQTWPIVPAPGDCEDGEFGGMNWQGNPKYSEKTCPVANLSTTNPTWPDPGSNPGRRGGKPATNRLSYGAASDKSMLIPYFNREMRALDEGFKGINKRKKKDGK
jgi:hypothetical protein